MIAGKTYLLIKDTNMPISDSQIRTLFKSVCVANGVEDKEFSVPEHEELLFEFVRKVIKRQLHLERSTNNDNIYRLSRLLKEEFNSLTPKAKSIIRTTRQSIQELQESKQPEE